MSKIATYASKPPPLAYADKIIGTDSTDGSTKNFNLSELNSLFSGSTVKVISELDQLGVPVAGYYQLPAGKYIFDGDIDFGTDGIDLIDIGGKYELIHNNFSQITYTGATPFIINTGTGVILQWYNGFVSTPNATAIALTNANSFINGTVLFVNCKKAGTMDTVDFFTAVDGLPMVACGDGFTLTDVGVSTITRPQWSNGQNLPGAVAFDFEGAASQRVVMSNLEDQTTVNEAFVNVNVNFGGMISIGGGVHTSGPFFAVGSRDQTDIDINVIGVSGVSNSRTVGSVTVQGNAIETGLTLGNWSDFDFGGLAQTTESNQAFTLMNTTTGEIRIDAPDGLEGSIFASISAVGSGGASLYEFRVVVNGSPVGVPAVVSANEISGTMSATPLLSDVILVQNDLVKLQVRNTASGSGITGSYVTYQVR
jgi:hypothetical protein